MTSQVALTGKSAFVSIKIEDVIFTCPESIILKHEECVLAKMLMSDNGSTPREVIPIDRDSTYFATILNYMRDETLDLEDFSERYVRKLRKEVDFYGLQKLIDICDDHLKGRPSPFNEMKISFGDLDPLKYSKLPFILLDYNFFRSFPHIRCAVELLNKMCVEEGWLFYLTNANGNDFHSTLIGYP